MNSQTKTCQNCKQDFTIEPEDFDFYTKIKVPPPTFCPECRMIRRLTWRNERSLFKRTCAKTGKQVITMFHPEAPVVVYDRDIWWSDEWDPIEFGQEYDFSRPFFEQFQKLLSLVPLANLGNTNVVNSPYGNHNADCKDCYLTFASFNNERVAYSRGAVELKDCMDIDTVEKSEQSSNDVICTGLYQTHYSYNTDESINSFFLQHSKNLRDCIGCINLRNKQYCIYNTQYTKEEYMDQKKSLDFGSYKALSNFEEKYSDFVLKFPHKYGNIGKSVNATGDNIGNSKNVKYCFDVFGEVEDSKYISHVIDLKEGYDGYGCGGGATLLYEGIDSGIKAANQYFAVLTHSSFNTRYTYMCYNSKNLFGCIGLRKKEYCILNKQYTKEEYETLVPKIIEHMRAVPYLDAKGQVYRYGEFFPSEISPFAYNETIAQEYFPKKEEEIQAQGYLFRKPEHKDYKITKQASELPDHINELENSILNETIACLGGGSELTQCTGAYRITSEELLFLKKNSIAAPRHCPNCRHYKRLRLRNPLKLWHRSCMCEEGSHEHSGKCSNEFETSYAPERPEKVYCESCYQKEVI